MKTKYKFFIRFNSKVLINCKNAYEKTKLLLLFVILILLGIQPHYSNEISSSKKNIYFFKQDSPWNLIIYGGRYTETDLLPILFRQRVNYKKSDIFVVGIARPLDFHFRNLLIELESNIGKHFGLMNHWEWNTFFIARLQSPFGLPMSLALGDGLSIASENPKLENKNSGWDLENFTYQTKSISSRNILNYLMVEFELGKPTYPFPSVFLRIHHRSGVFGLYCKPDPACGSNFITYGVRFPLDSLY